MKSVLALICQGYLLLGGSRRKSQSENERKSVLSSDFFHHFHSVSRSNDKKVCEVEFVQKVSPLNPPRGKLEAFSNGGLCFYQIFFNIVFLRAFVPSCFKKTLCLCAFVFHHLRTITPRRLRVSKLRAFVAQKIQYLASTSPLS